MAELSTVLGLEDLYDIIEVILVDAHNRRVINEIDERRRQEQER